jgi:precorrin-3B C17-methyltransferase
VDMFTTVLIGNSTSYVHNGHIVTPRGYEEKVSNRSD